MLAQNPLEFMAPGPADQRRMYEMRIRMEVQEMLDEWKRRWEEGEIDDLMELYAEGAVVFPAQGATIRGERELRAYFSARDVADLASATVAFGTSGDHAYVVEVLSYRAPPGARTPVEETALLVMRRSGGFWRIVIQLARPDRSPRLPLSP